MADEQQLVHLWASITELNGCAAWNQWHKDDWHSGRGGYKTVIDLGGADLSDAYLGYAHLSGANLGYAHLGCADLRGAHLNGAHLRGADLGGADPHAVARKLMTWITRSGRVVPGKNRSRLQRLSEQLERLGLPVADITYGGVTYHLPATSSG